MTRCFEKISFEEWKKDIGSNKDIFERHEIPRRQTKCSAGYDFKSPIEFILHPQQCKTIPTGVKVNMNSNEFLMIVVRSSMGFHYNVRLTNQVGIVESDYYNNPDNEGHIWIQLQNHGDKDYIVKIGDRIAQGIFINFLNVDGKEEILQNRKSGIGSTNEEEK